MQGRGSPFCFIPIFIGKGVRARPDDQVGRGCGEQ